MRNKTYTQEEINKALFELNNRLSKKKEERTNINTEIRAIKKNIEYYETLDKRQTRISW
jgi:CII-binding regulator of phage lambda lysogenization HflD